METHAKNPIQNDDRNTSVSQPQTISEKEISQAEPESLSSVRNTCVEDSSAQKETGGYENGKDPTRYGDWEIAGRCVDF